MSSARLVGFASHCSAVGPRRRGAAFAEATPSSGGVGVLGSTAGRGRTAGPRLRVHVIPLHDRSRAPASREGACSTRSLKAVECTRLLLPE